MISWEYPPHTVGGLGRHVADILPELAAPGLEVHLLTLRGTSPRHYEQLNPHATVYRVYSPESDADIVTQVAAATDPVLAAAHVLWHDVGGFDLIHVHDWLLADVAIALKHHYRRPLVATIHAHERGRRRGDISAPESQIIDAIEWRLTYEAWRVIVCSAYMQAQLLHDFSVPADKLDIIPNGIVAPAASLTDPASRAAFRSRYQPSTDPLVFAVGRLVHEKGWHVLIAAVAALVPRYPQLTLVLAGVGGYRDDLVRVATQLGVGNNVALVGFISDDERNGLYGVADCAVFPSLYEPFGIVALEAMALRCPVIVSDTGGLREVVCADKTGLLVPPDDVDALAAAIVDTLTAHTATQTRVAAAYVDATTHYTWQRVAEATAATYRRIAAEWAAGNWGN
jgi:glycosyltransferase involved in cell wall biosynthesis